MKPNTISGAFRYSNFESGAFRTGILPRYSHEDSTSGDGGTATGSAFDWGSFFGNLFTSASSVATSIWGHNNQWQAQAYNTMYEQERRTNTILWVVIGLVVALGVFLVVRKTK